MSQVRLIAGTLEDAAAEFDQRVAAAYGARTRAQLRALTADLPAGTAYQPRPATGPDPWLLCLLLCMCPPAGLVYWLVITRRAPAGDPSTDEAVATPGMPPQVTAKPPF